MKIHGFTVFKQHQGICLRLLTFMLLKVSFLLFAKGESRICFDRHNEVISSVNAIHFMLYIAKL